MVFVYITRLGDIVLDHHPCVTHLRDTSMYSFRESIISLLTAIVQDRCCNKRVWHRSLGEGYVSSRLGACLNWRTIGTRRSIDGI